MRLDTKWQHLAGRLRATGGCVVAYSGGADSGLLAAAAREVLGSRCLAVLVRSPLQAPGDVRAAAAWLRDAGIPHRVLLGKNWRDPAVRANGPLRCYHCKRNLLLQVRNAAGRLPAVAEGSNADDRREDRPGRRAVQELGVLSPLADAGLTKNEVRRLAHERFRLPMAFRPAESCLATRIPTGRPLIRRELAQVRALEGRLRSLGFQRIRVRHDGASARLEVGPEDRPLLERPGTWETCRAEALRLGWTDFMKSG